MMHQNKEIGAFLSEDCAICAYRDVVAHEMNFRTVSCKNNANFDMLYC
jgi:hypothetical protein